MPEMYEIYQKYAAQYDELVRAEDYENNLGRLLYDYLDWQNAKVMEAGVGTGRVTHLYIEQVASALCCDRSSHMLAFARDALAPYHAKLTFKNADNTDLPKLDQAVDIFIEGWSFGHCAGDCADMQEITQMTTVLVENAMKNLKSGGTAVFIETLGTNTPTPAPPHEKLHHFYTELEQNHGFQRQTIRTDYQFPSNSEAARIMGFFFGEAMKQTVLEQGSTIIPEWTGIWLKRI